jgi:ferredoxin
MTYVVKENCINCKSMDCVEVCPVDCFYEGKNFLVIHPDECIDCGVCEPECPQEAITSDADDPGDLAYWLAINRKYSEDGDWPVVTQKKEPMPDHEKFDKLKGYEGDKKEMLDPTPGEGDA